MSFSDNYPVICTPLTFAQNVIHPRVKENQTKKTL